MESSNLSSLKQKTIYGIIISALLLSLVISPVAANSSDSIICQGDSASNNAEQIFQYIIGVFMALGFVLGMLFWAAEQFEKSIGGMDVNLLGDIDGKESLRKAILLPLIVYFFDFISQPLFGINITCLIPS